MKSWKETREIFVGINPKFSELSDEWQFGIDLEGADLGGADLRGAYLRNADLGGADLRGAKLRGANLGGADLRGADLGGADLRGADLRGANLGGANLGGAYLGGANLEGANLGGAYLGGANLEGANLEGANLPRLSFEKLAMPELVRQILAIVEQEPHRLQMDQWHTCATTHCVWGWAVTLNGAAGLELEASLGIITAGALLFPEFSENVFDSNEAALEKLRELSQP